MTICRGSSWRHKKPDEIINIIYCVTPCSQNLCSLSYSAQTAISSPIICCRLLQSLGSPTNETIWILTCRNRRCLIADANVSGKSGWNPDCVNGSGYASMWWKRQVELQFFENVKTNKYIINLIESSSGDDFGVCGAVFSVVGLFRLFCVLYPGDRADIHREVYRLPECRIWPIHPCLVPSNEKHLICLPRTCALTEHMWLESIQNCKGKFMGTSIKCHLKSTLTDLWDTHMPSCLVVCLTSMPELAVQSWRKSLASVMQHGNRVSP